MRRFSRSPRLVINYDLRDAGPPGVGSVDLWYTRDTHRWARIPLPAPQQSPCVVEVNEDGTEAAAATGVVIKSLSAVVNPDPVFRADHPFFFVIRDNRNGSVLFAGRLASPEK